MLLADHSARVQAYASSDSQDQVLVRRLTSDTEFATAVKLQQLHDAATAAVKFLKAISASSHRPSFREEAAHHRSLPNGTPRSLESSRQLSKSSRSAEAQLLDSVLSSQPLPGSSATESQPLPGHPRSAYYPGGSMRSFSSQPAMSEHSSHDHLSGPQLVQLRGIPRTGPHQALPMASCAVLAHAPTGAAPSNLKEVPDSLDDIVQALEGGELSLLPEITSAGMGLSMAGPTLIPSAAGLHTRPSAEEQMLVAAAELAASSAPLARLAMPTVSEGPSSVLQDLRKELLQLEEAIPWTAVRKHWRTKRSAWRRAVRDADSAAAMAGCLRDLHMALLVHAYPGHTGGRSTLNLGPVWQQSLASCLDGGEKHAMLLALWNDFKKQVSLWLGAISIQPTGTAVQPSRTKAARALRALLQAETQGAEAVMQVPLDAILNGDSEALETMKAILSQEQLSLAARCECVRKGVDSEHAENDDLDHASMLENFACDSEDCFDSGAESVDECSQATDMSDLE
ncbi:hypothetical protein WJX74_008537 [Apatococcus lobatus]|uniref:Uncharacterized protein n=2 Tax=Apatococcus TaxID=904362 RepID=A0AAW1SKI1_9CHLO